MEHKEIACNFEDGEPFTISTGMRVKYLKCDRDLKNGEKCFYCCLRNLDCGVELYSNGACCDGGYFVADDEKVGVCENGIQRDCV